MLKKCWWWSQAQGCDRHCLLKKKKNNDLRCFKSVSKILHMLLKTPANIFLRKWTFCRRFYWKSCKRFYWKSWGSNRIFCWNDAIYAARNTFIHLTKNRYFLKIWMLICVKLFSKCICQTSKRNYLVMICRRHFVTKQDLVLEMPSSEI